MEPLSVSVAEASRLLSVSPRTIRRYIRLGRIRVSRLGRRIVVPIDSLKTLLRECER